MDSNHDTCLKAFPHREVGTLAYFSFGSFARCMALSSLKARGHANFYEKGWMNSLCESYRIIWSLSQLLKYVIVSWMQPWRVHKLWTWWCFNKTLFTNQKGCRFGCVLVSFLDSCFVTTKLTSHSRGEKWDRLFIKWCWINEVSVLENKQKNPFISAWHYTLKPSPWMCAWKLNELVKGKATRLLKEDLEERIDSLPYPGHKKQGQ